MKRINITIDAGHGSEAGKDQGAESRGMKEGIYTLNLSRALDRELQIRGYNTTLTRPTDKFVSLGNRVRISNRNNTDLFVSLHANSYDTLANGFEVLHYPNSRKSIKASQAVLDAFAEAYPNLVNRGLKPRRNLFVLRATNSPAILIETQFLDWTGGALSFFTDCLEIDNQARAIADGIDDYFLP